MKEITDHQAQLLTYLKLGGWTVGLLINFNVPFLKNGINEFVPVRNIFSIIFFCILHNFMIVF